MQRKDWTLLAINAANGKGLSAVQLQKVLFLLEQGVPTEVGDSYYNFKPYNYGPFDPLVYEDARRLATKNLVNISSPFGQRYNVYSITPEGVEKAIELEHQVPPRAVRHLNEVVSWVKSVTFGELLRAIYSNYPDMKANSVFTF
ncbi:MAG: hypothetical protein M3R69_10880 [Acidobacteriota bacterium]|nr:hypothetical protein [Acidobacteriota bacterium]